MAGIDFPITVSEVSKMHEDGDTVSLLFSYECLILMPHILCVVSCFLVHL
jgi:hypothetical protein